MKPITAILVFVFILPGMLSTYSQAEEALHIPQVGRKAIDSYQFDYLYAGKHRAFAIAPGGAWSWVADQATEVLAKESALEACSKYTQQKCQLFDVNGQQVFDQESWFESWGPYKTPDEAKQAEIGTRVGQRFYDVSFTNAQGEKKSISDLRGKVVFVHFWGCWCPSCRYEFGTLIDKYRILNSEHEDDIELVVLQVRESIETASNWAKKNKLTALPLSDSGVKSEEDNQLTLKDGTRILDRKLARVFPASYVLDKNGLVVFSHMGSIKDWTEYVPFYSDVVARSNK